MVVCCLPLSQGISTENSPVSSKISLKEDKNSLKVNAAYKKVKIKVKVKVIVKQKYYSKTAGKWLYKNVTGYKYITKYKKVNVKSAKSYSYKVGATNIFMNSGYVESKARCSCSLHKDYNLHYSKFKNYCPFCKERGTLRYEEGPSCPEGMWFCKSCDADYCLVHGKSHTSKAKYLKRA